MSEGDIAVMKSCSDGELLCPTNGADKSITDNSHNNSEHTTKLKRTFTLPRNPFNTTRMSKRKNNKINTQNNEHSENNDNRNSNKKVFRRPSWKKFINKLAQHINYTDRKNNAYANDNRVPPVSGHQWAPDQTPGVTGLRNHGNTCFMNAVLQCLAHTDILAEYFVLDQYKIDMSRRNKLNARKFGTRGELTEQLALLLKALWACRYSPEISTAFKATVERHGAQFRGTQQQDAQEFLLWLLDKVHEDLNTASKKKYKAIKTQGRPDEVIAAETLANHMRCNSSFVQAVFQAQYRSSLACPRCLKQSNTFDLFHCISVQLPQLSMHPVYVTVLYTSQQPRQVKLGVSVSSSATVLELRDLLASDTSILRSDMLLIEIGTSGFGRTLHDAQPVACIADTDPVYCIEAPQLKDATATTDDDVATVTSAYVLLCWINVVIDEDGNAERFGSPYTMQVSRETSYADLQKLILKEMAPILHDDILTSSQPAGIFNMRVWDAACDDLEPPYYLETGLEHPLFTEAIDQSLALCPDDGGSPPHVKLVLEWSRNSKEAIIADDSDPLEEHWSVGAMRAGSGATNQPRLTLADCLRHYTRAETLAGDDSWRCPHCQQYIPVVKTLGLWSLPDILVIHFKRFRQQQIKGRHSSKLTTMVDFPLYGFDMTPHLANKNAMNSANNVSGDPMILGGLGWSPWKRPRKPSHSSDNTYDLYAVCYHHGDDLETGHYTAACRNPYDNHWYGYDDTKVTDLSQKSEDISSELVNNSAYILFYQKRSGIYVGSSSNSSSAASTSSVGSSGEHWISRMPKFEYVPPKNDKKTPNSQTEKKTVTVTSTIPKSATITKMETDTDNSTNKQTESKEISPAENSKPSSPAVSNENIEITLRSPKLKGSSTNVSRKSLENKATNTVESAIAIQKKSPTESVMTRKSLDSTVKVSSAQQTDIQQRRSLDTKMTYTAPIETVIQRNIEPQKPMYKTSIYINSLGNVDITTKCVNDSPIMVNGNHVPEREVTVVVNNDTRRDSFYRGERGYATLGPSGRKSIPTDDVEAEKLYHSDDEAPLARFDWMR